jgi:hypothetical protein
VISGFSDKNVYETKIEGKGLLNNFYFVSQP